MQRTPTPRLRWLALAGGVLVLVAGLTFGAVLLLRAGDEDPGVTACRAAAQNAKDGDSPTEEESDQQIGQLKSSSHDDLRKVGEKLEALASAEDLDLAQGAAVASEMTAACARQGVVIQT